MPTYDSGSVAVGYTVSGDHRIAALEGAFLNGAPQVWLSLNLTYSFPTGAASWDGGLNYGKGEISAGWLPLSAAQQAAVRQALAAWSAVSSITFTEVADGTTVGDLRFGFTSAITGTMLGWGYYPVSDSARAGDVWIKASLAGKAFEPSINQPFGAYSQESAYDYFALLHEIGHALGLSHPFAETGETRGTAVLPTSEDNYNNTIMSYSAESNHGGIPSTPMPYDILAIQYLYGRDFYHNTGNTTYTYDINDINLLTIWDAAGEDTIAASNNSNITLGNGTMLFSVIDLREGAGSKIGFTSTAWADPAYSTVNGFGWRSAWSNIYIAYGCVIENAVGTNGNDLITGNPVNNKITGGLGSDAIDGGAGIDTSIYSLSRSNYTVAKTGTGYSVTDNFTSINQFGRLTHYGDTLTNVERLAFADTRIALDVTGGNAGTTAKILGTVFGKDSVLNTTYVGIGLNYLDGGMSYADLIALALNAAGATTSNAIVTLLWTNLFDVAPTTAEVDPYVAMLDSGSMSAGALGVAAADTSFNTANINLVGLAQTGIEFV